MDIVYKVLESIEKLMDIIFTSDIEGEVAVNTSSLIGNIVHLVTLGPEFPSETKFRLISLEQQELITEFRLRTEDGVYGIIDVALVCRARRMGDQLELKLYDARNSTVDTTLISLPEGTDDTWRIVIGYHCVKMYKVLGETVYECILLPERKTSTYPLLQFELEFYNLHITALDPEYTLLQFENEEQDVQSVLLCTDGSMYYAGTKGTSLLILKSAQSVSSSEGRILLPDQDVEYSVDSRTCDLKATMDERTFMAFLDTGRMAILRLH